MPLPPGIGLQIDNAWKTKSQAMLEMACGDLTYLLSVQAAVGGAIGLPEGARHPVVGQHIPEECLELSGGLWSRVHQWLGWRQGLCRPFPSACSASSVIRRCVDTPCTITSLLVKLPSLELHRLVLDLIVTHAKMTIHGCFPLLSMVDARNGQEACLAEGAEGWMAWLALAVGAPVPEAPL